MSDFKLLYETMELAGQLEIVAKELESIEADASMDALDFTIQGRVRRESVARIMPTTDRNRSLMLADEYIESLVKEVNAAIIAIREKRLAQLETELRELLRKAIEA